MAIYDMLWSQLDSLLAGNVSAPTADLIAAALKQAGFFPGPAPAKIVVETDAGTPLIAAGADTLGHPVQFFLETARSGTVEVRAHNVVVAAGDGKEQIIQLGLGGDTLVGGAGKTFLEATEGNNRLVGGSGANTLFGGLGVDTLVGGGKTVMHAVGGGDVLIGGLCVGASDTLIGGSGHDAFYTGPGSDSIVGSTGSDTVHADSSGGALFFRSSLTNTSAGQDSLYLGSTGADTVVGGGASKTVVHVGELSTAATHHTVAGGATDFTFTGSSLTLEAKNVTIVFSDNKTLKV